MRIKRIHHLTLAVRDVEQARATFEALFETDAEPTTSVPVFGVRTRNIAIGDDVLQVAAPLQPNGPLARFVERRGEGFYNLALEVDDLDEAVRQLTERGIKVSEPVEAWAGMRSCFVTMSATHGLSIQLVETFGDAPEPGAPPADERSARIEADAPSADEQASTPPPQTEQRVLDLTPDEWSDDD